MTTMHDTVLKSWKTLNELLPELREDQVRDLLNWELENGKRPDIVTRLHQRFSKLVGIREREELMARIK
jgi:hypothetical protein